jgi:hypothetical protein
VKLYVPSQRHPDLQSTSTRALNPLKDLKALGEDQFGGNFEQAEMVKAFIVSGEYRNRFRL